MPRTSQVKPISVRKEQIRQRTLASSSMDNLPIWEGEKSVQCRVIKIPLDHLLFRLRNGRTVDAQEHAVATKAIFSYPEDGTESSPCNLETFKSENEGSQDSQDHQFELLVNEAKKASGRVGAKNLIDILKADGYQNTDRPVITPEGVLINGNCRVATIEYLLQKKIPIKNIDSKNPMIEVKVVPTPPTGESSIEELERQLQLGDVGRLEYNWIQITTDMRKKKREFGNNEAALKRVHALYSHLELYSKFNEMKIWLEARALLDSTLKAMGREGQAYGLNPPQFLFKSAIIVQNRAKKDGWNNPQNINALRAIVEVMMQVSIENKAEKELRYDLAEIKNEDDLNQMLKSLTEAGLTDVEIVEKIDPITNKKKTTKKVKTNKKPSADEIKKAAKAIRKSASDIKESHDDKDLENKPKKKLEEIQNNLGYYSTAMDKAKANSISVDTEELKSQFNSILETINSELAKL
jgi:hypothetical protein